MRRPAAFPHGRAARRIFVFLAAKRPRRSLLLAPGSMLAVLFACAPAPAAIYFRSSSTAQTGSGAKEVTVSAPPGLVAGDVMIASVDAEGGGGITAPSGWSSTNLYEGVTYFGYAGVYYHVAGASEPSSYTWNLGSSRKAIGKILDYVGVENSSPLEVASTNAGANTGTSQEAPSITTTVNKTMVIMDLGAVDSSGSFTITTPSGTTNRASVFTTGSGSVVGSDAVDFIQSTAGATGSKTYKTSASTSWGTITIALKPGSGALGFDVAPSVPAFPTVTLKGEAQTTHATMGEFAVDDTNTESGWNVSVNGNSNSGKSPVFKQYCENGASACGATAAHTYVSGGHELPAGSLQLSTSGASWSTTGGSGSAPTFECNTATCSVDSATATKIVSTAAKAGLGPWKASGFSSSSLALLTPSTIYALPEHEIYHVDLTWTLSSGP